MLPQTEMVKTALSKLWMDKCTITEYQEYTKTNKSTGHKEVTVCSGVPCRLSFNSAPNTNNSGGASSVIQTIKLFLKPDIVIKAGSKISITRNGTTVDYKRSGEPSKYDSHQEVELMLFDGWS